VTFLPVKGSAGGNSVYIADQLNSAPVCFRPEGVFGLGVDYSLSNSLALRAEYRGQLYKSPDYGLGFQRTITFTNEPTVSLTYTFGRRKTTPPTPTPRQP
jgi:hypothetical protein